MSLPKYMIGTGYHPHATSAWFYPLWLGNTLRHSRPEQVVVLADSGAQCPEWHPTVQWLSMNGDLGHVYDLLMKRKDYDWCGWSMVICITALIAYFNECDYIHKEADCLAFGPWVDQIYKEAGEWDVLTGKAKDIPCAQSLFWVRHRFIPEFVRLYLGTGQERTEEQFGELKFQRLEKEHPRNFSRYSFGFDRERPIRYTDKVFYAQKLTPVEMGELENAGHLTIPQPMPSVAAFTGEHKYEV